MTQTEEYDEEAEAAGDESMTGPGAPTPLSALEVSLSPRNQVELGMMCASQKLTPNSESRASQASPSATFSSL